MKKAFLISTLIADINYNEISSVTTNFDIKKWRGFWTKGNSNCSFRYKIKI